MRYLAAASRELRCRADGLRLLSAEGLAARCTVGGWGADKGLEKGRVSDSGGLLPEAEDFVARCLDLVQPVLRELEIGGEISRGLQVLAKAPFSGGNGFPYFARRAARRRVSLVTTVL